MDLSEIGFDFEEMARLAKDHPDAFARRREELIQGLIARSSRSAQLADLQMDLDALRYAAPPGLQSGEKMLVMMFESTASMTTELARLTDLIEAANAEAKA